MSYLDKIYAENIAKEYAPKQANKVRQLRKLDEKARTPAFAVSLSVGMLSALIFGIGVCFVTGQFGGSVFGMIIGIVIGMVGIGMCIMNYPLYKRLLEKGKSKYAFEILELAKEIAEENGER